MLVCLHSLEAALLSVADSKDPREFCRMVNLVLTIDSDGAAVVKMVATQGISGIVQSYEMTFPQSMFGDCVEHAIAAKEFVKSGGEYAISLSADQCKWLLGFSKSKSNDSGFAYIFAPTDRELNDLKTESVDIKLDTRTGAVIDYKLDVKRAIFKTETIINLIDKLALTPWNENGLRLTSINMSEKVLKLLCDMVKTEKKLRGCKAKDLGSVTLTFPVEESKLGERISGDDDDPKTWKYKRETVEVGEVRGMVLVEVGTKGIVTDSPRQNFKAGSFKADAAIMLMRTADKDPLKVELLGRDKTGRMKKEDDAAQ